MILGYHWRNRFNKNHFQQKLVLRQDKSPPLSAHKRFHKMYCVLDWCWPYLHFQQFQVESRCSNLWDLAICDGPVLYCCLVWWMAGEAGSREESLWGERGKFRTLDIAGCRTISVFRLVFQGQTKCFPLPALLTLPIWCNWGNFSDFQPWHQDTAWRHVRSHATSKRYSWSMLHWRRECSLQLRHCMPWQCSTSFFCKEIATRIRRNN